MSFGLLLRACLSLSLLIGGREALECLNCRAVADPLACNSTVACASGESCYTQTVDSSPDMRYDMGCQRNQLCSSSAVNTGSIVGRSIYKRQQYTCHECCSTNECNEQLCAHRKPSACIDDQSLDCARLNSLLNVCADVQHAKTICPRFCGLCSLVDGNWAQWSSWSSCDVTCENGTEIRTRACTNPAPQNGGLNCTGYGSQSRVCVKPLCPVHGGWSGWGSWGDCSVTCDVGLSNRKRTCTNPKPLRFGDHCDGESIDNRVCLREHCNTRDGGWTSWQSWTSCSVTCGAGIKSRQRNCTNPVPAFGKHCEGDNKIYDVCINTPCAKVAFNAHGVNILSNYVSAFPIVLFNEGNAYNASSGQFTAPVTGIYYFTAQICVASSNTVLFYIIKGPASMSGAQKLTATRDHHGSSGCTSVSTSVRLNKTEHVSVQMYTSYGPSYFDEHSATWNTFTGALIQEY